MTRPRLFRRLAIIATFAFSGALITIAIAWGSAAFVNLDGPPHAYCVLRDSSAPERVAWHFIRIDALATTSVVVMSTPMNPDLKLADAPAPNPWWCTLLDDAQRSAAAAAATAPPDAPFRGTMLRDDAYGFPISALACRFDVLWNRVEGGIDITPPPAPGPAGSSVMRFRALPTRPLVAGFVIDTILWALLFWLVTLAPFQLRRWLHSRRGACIRCAYLLHGATTCPECGAASDRATA